MYYYIQDQKENILLRDTDLERITNTINLFMPQYKGYEIQETETEIVEFEGELYFVTDEEYIEKVVAKRQEEFLNKFFKITLPKSLVKKGYAYYRKQPKGYSSAIESIMAAERMCAKMEGLPAGTIILYPEPNFTKPAQCTEEWLVENQIALPALDVESFDTLFVAFVQAWNNQEHATIEGSDEEE